MGHNRSGVRTRHASPVYQRDSHGPSTWTPPVEGLSYAEARDGEQMQQPDIGPGAVDGGIHIAPGTVETGSFAPQVFDALSVGGANQVQNSSFENVVDGEWSMDSPWVADYASADPFDGTLTARVVTVGAGLSELSQSNIFVDREDDWWFSFWSFLSAIGTGGTVEAYVSERDAGGSFLQSTSIDLTDVETGWTRHQLHFGPDDSEGRNAFHADTAKVNVVFAVSSAVGTTWEVDAVQFERGKLATAFAPHPTEIKDGSITSAKIVANNILTEHFASDAVIANVVNVGGTVTIDDDGITIEDGALALLDDDGTSVLTGAGFQGAWRDFIGDGLYNSRFAAGPDGFVTTALPYWQVTLSAGMTAERMTNVFGPFLRFQATGTTGTAQSVQIDQEVVLKPGARVKLRIVAIAGQDPDDEEAGAEQITADFEVVSIDSFVEDLDNIVFPTGLSGAEWSSSEAADTDVRVLEYVEVLQPSAVSGRLSLAFNFPDGTVDNQKLDIYSISLIQDASPLAGDPDDTNLFHLDGSIQMSGGSTIISPGFAFVPLSVSFNANANDYNPAGWDTANMIVFGGLTATRTLTGLAAKADGTFIILVNNSGSSLVLQHDDGSTSTAANRFYCPDIANVTIRRRGSVSCVYYASRWHVLAI